MSYLSDCSHISTDPGLKKFIKFRILFNFCLPCGPLEIFIDLDNILEIVESKLTSAHIQYELR